MKVCLFHEGICPPGTSWEQRVQEMMDEAVYAEQCGFDIYATGEQHFAGGEATVSSPEIVLPYVAARTSVIRLRLASVNLLPYNHPIRVVEQVSTLDLLSNGRAELGGARSNNPYTLDGFGIDPALTRAYRDEHLQIIGKAFLNEKLSHKSEYYDIPPRKIAPWPSGRRPVPVHLSTTSLESHTEAGAMGVGAMSGLSILGWDYLQACIDAYHRGAERAEPVAGAINRRQAVLSMGVNCHHDAKTAKAVTRDNSLRFLEVIMNWMTRLAKRSDGYAYFAQIEKLKAHMKDFDFLINTGPYFMVGTPDEIVERCRRMHDMGIDDVVWRIDGMGHENNLKALKIIGDHVLPVLHSWPEHAVSTPSATWTTSAPVSSG